MLPHIFPRSRTVTAAPRDFWLPRLTSYEAGKPIKSKPLKSTKAREMVNME